MVTDVNRNPINSISGGAISTGSVDKQSSNRTLNEHNLNHKNSTYAGNTALLKEAGEAGIGVDTTMFEQGAMSQQATIVTPEVLSHP